VIGDDVLITLKGSDGLGRLLRRLVGFDGHILRLLQYNPRLETDLALDRVAEIYPCVAWGVVDTLPEGVG
jgi:hypothetical protein